MNDGAKTISVSWKGLKNVVPVVEASPTLFVIKVPRGDPLEIILFNYSITTPTRSRGDLADLHHHFPKKALLKVCKFKIPHLPCSLDKQILAQLTNLILHWWGSCPDQRKSLLILLIFLTTQLGNLNIDI